MSHKIVIRIAFFAALLIGAPLVRSETSTLRQGINGYTGTVDTHVRLDQPTGGFATSTFVHVDNDNPVAHGLLRFDDIFGEGPGQVPPWADLFWARLIFYTTSDSDPVWFHRMLVPWDEANTWNDLSTSGPGLQADGIEMAATPDFTFTASLPVPRVDSFDVTATVAGWLAGNFPNYGWGITNQIANGWMFSSSEDSIHTNRPALEISFHAGPRPIEILMHPTSVAAVEGDSVSFSVILRGRFPEYQWFKDNVAIPAGTNATYTIPVVRQSDAGNYHVAVDTEWQLPVLSSNAVLTVTPAPQPSVMCVYGTNDNVTLFVVFSQVVTNANDWVNYSIVPSGGGEQLTVASAVYPGGATEGSTVVLTLDSSTPLQPGLSYTLSAGGVFNRLGDPVDPNEVTPVTLYFESIFTISASDIWAFNDSGADLGGSWTNPYHDDSNWNSGPALLGFETATAILPEPLRTTVRLTNSAGARIQTYYFRKHFAQFGVTGRDLLRFRTVLDDAAAIYLNGAEIFRLRLPAGPLDYMTQGFAAVGDAVYEGPFTICVTNLVNGYNVLAAEVHQTGQSSSDLVFGLELLGMWPHPPPHCLQGPTNQTVSAGDSVTFSVRYCGRYREVQWFKDGAAIPGATNLTYTIGSVVTGHAGYYYVCVDSNYSSLARLTVLPRLRIELSADGSEVILTWDGFATLEQTSSLHPAQWREVEGAISGYRTPRTGMRFFRLHEP